MDKKKVLQRKGNGGKRGPRGEKKRRSSPVNAPTGGQSVVLHTLLGGRKKGVVDYKTIWEDHKL